MHEIHEFEIDSPELTTSSANRDQVLILTNFLKDKMKILLETLEEIRSDSLSEIQQASSKQIISSETEEISIEQLDSSKKRRKDRPSSKPKRIKQGRPQKPFSKASKRTQKERIKKFCEHAEKFLGEQSSLEVTEMFAGYFLVNHKQLLPLLQKALEQGKISKENISHLVQDLKEQPDLELLLYLKDLHALADNKLWIICRAAGRSFSLTRLIELRKTTNKEAEEYFQIKKDPKNPVIQCSVERALLSLFDIEKKEQKKIPNHLQIKVTADGRAFKKGQFVISLTPLNLRTFLIQSRDSVFQILLAQAKENHEMTRELCRGPYLQLQQIAEKGLMYKGQLIPVKIFFIPGQYFF